ncbi:hypothetical protein [Agriterribacter sp.]|uniref:hypothetical protein n=1 Tax=Agriterribacter sp. TaxID=2821509 RepID=UPI002C8ED450|nr:hypothetical protein [Agriterribacter sp.]HTN06735.1 hypothetical protein [Agriterribacter sp.]
MCITKLKYTALFILLLACACSCEKDHHEETQVELPPYYLKADINGTPTMCAAHAKVNRPSYSPDVWFLEGYSGVNNDSTHVFSPSVEATLPDYISLQVYFSGIKPTVGFYGPPVSQQNMTNFASISLFKFQSVDYLNANYRQYNSGGIAGPSTLNITSISDSTIEGNFSANVYSSGAESQIIKIENGGFLLKIK